MKLEAELIAWIDAHGKSATPVDRDTAILEDGIVDSLLLTDLLLFIETRIGRPLVVEDLEPAAFRCVATIAAAFAGSSS